MLVQQIDPSIIVALIGIGGGVLPYLYTRNKEVNANIREEKTERYDDLMKALFRMVKVANTYKPGYDERQHRMLYDAINDYMSAYHRASTFASDDVLRRCNYLHSMIEEHPDQEADIIGSFTDRIIAIYKEIRRDINPKAKYTSVMAVWTPSYEPEEIIEEGKSSGAPIKIK